MQIGCINARQEQTDRVVDSHEPHWYALQSKPLREGLAARSVGRLGVEVFLPMARDCRIFRGKRRPVDKPLFSGYLFARFDFSFCLRPVRYAQGVIRVVSSGELPLVVDEEIIDGIRSRINSDGVVQLEPQVVRPGDRVAILDGVFQGMCGVFERELDDRARVLILLDMISGARVSVERAALEAADRLN